MTVIGVIDKLYADDWKLCTSLVSTVVTFFKVHCLIFIGLISGCWILILANVMFFEQQYALQ